MRASVVAVLFKIAASFLFIAVFARIGVHPFLGLALSTSVAAWINFSWLAVALRRRIGSLAGERVAATFLGMAGVSVVMGLACVALHGLLEAVAGGGGIVGELARLLVTVLAGVAIVVLGGWSLGVPEARQLAARLVGRGGR